MAAPMVKTPLPNFIRFGRDICGNLAEAERREWWLGNGLGGYAAGTVAGTLTRRYHGLLIAPVNPPLGRYLVFAKADATLSDGEREWPLSTNRWGGGTVEPQGYVHIESFHLEGRMPVWRYAIGDAVIEQRIWLEPGANTTYVAYRLEPNPLHAQKRLKLSVKLLINARDHHVNTQPWQFNPVIECQTHSLHVGHPNWFTLHFRTCCGSIESRHDWYENFDLSVERERGLPERDNHLCVGVANFELRSGEWVGFVASLDERASPYLELGVITGVLRGPPSSVLSVASAPRRRPRPVGISPALPIPVRLCRMRCIRDRGPSHLPGR